jgi:hypothetical protein
VQVKVTLQVFAGEQYDGGAPVTEVVTDNEGRFMASLPAGRYCIVRSGRGPRPTGPVQPDEELECYVREWQRCDAIVDVPVKVPVALDHTVPCWSSCYRGPPPP